MAFLFVVSPVAVAAPQVPDRPQGSKLPDGVTRIALPAGKVTWEYVRGKDGMALRVTAGEAVVEGQRLFYGDGVLAMEVVATAGEGIHFVHVTGLAGPDKLIGPIDNSPPHGVLMGGKVEEPGAKWFLEPSCPTALDLKPGSVYVTSPSVKFERKR